MKNNIIELKKHYENMSKQIDDYIFDSDPSETTITRMLIEKHCYIEFIKKLDKILK